MIHGSSITVARLRAKKGAVVPTHSHVNEQITTMEKGAMLFVTPADRIVVFTHPEGQRAYLEDDFAQEAERRFGIPVVRSEVGR